MDRILTEIERQQECTPTSALNTMLTMVKFLLAVPYPNKLKRPLEEEYDFIVVGAGSGGSPMASRLSENPHWKVALLEAGGEEPEITRVPGLVKTDGMFDTCVEWGYNTEPHPDYCGGKPCTYGRAKMMGGCDSHNGMWYLRGHKKLFDGYFRAGHQGWSYDEVWPYFARRYRAFELNDDGTIEDLSVERFPHIDQNVNIIMDAYKEMGIREPDRNGKLREGYKTTSKNGTRVSANRWYIEKVRYKRPNLHISTQTFVTKVLIDPVTKRATGVEAIRNDDGFQEKVVLKARKEVIVSAGVINSPKLLQLSGLGPRKHLEGLGIPVIKDLPVGYSLLHHPVFHAINLKLTSTAIMPESCESIRDDIINYIINKSGPFASSGAFNSYLLTNSSRSTREFPDLLFAFNPSIEGLDIHDPFFCTCYYNKLNLGVMAGISYSFGTVLIRSADPWDSPKISLGINHLDKKIIAEGAVLAHKIANSKAFKDNGIYADNTPNPNCKDYKYASYEYWRCDLEGKLDLWLHGVSTCKMGKIGDPHAVVDHKCRVQGIKGLRVADASIAMNVSNANINSIVLMTGERCADFIIHKHL